MPAKAADIPDCPYCQSPSVLAKGAVIYPHRSDLAGKDFWHCAPCKSWVGCHDGTLKPLGRLADAKLRAAKTHAHAAFDRLWQGKMRRDKCSKKAARGAGYAWLADQLGIAREDCHIGLFDVETCARVVQVCKGLRRTNAA